MSTLEAALVVVAFLTLSLGGTYAVLRWAMPDESPRDRIVREAHERADAAARLDPTTLARAAGPADPHWAAGVARIHGAVRDDQPGGHRDAS